MRWLQIAALLLFGCLLTLGTNYYVTPTGNDANDGTAADDAHAWLTISYAVQNVPAGTHVIYVKDGVAAYTNAKWSVTTGYTAADAITVEGYVTAPGDGVKGCVDYTLTAADYGFDSAACDAWSLTWKYFAFSFSNLSTANSRAWRYATDCDLTQKWQSCTITLPAGMPSTMRMTGGTANAAFTRVLTFDDVAITSPSRAPIDVCGSAQTVLNDVTATLAQDSTGSAFLTADAAGAMGAVAIDGLVFTGYSFCYLASNTAGGSVSCKNSTINCVSTGFWVYRFSPLVEFENNTITATGAVAFDYLVGAGSSDTAEANPVGIFNCRYNTMRLAGAGNGTQHLHYRGCLTGGETCYSDMRDLTTGQSSHGLVEKGTHGFDHHNVVVAGNALALAGAKHARVTNNTFVNCDPTRNTIYILKEDAAADPDDCIVRDNIFSDVAAASAPTYFVTFSGDTADLKLELGNNIYHTQATNFCNYLGAAKTRAELRAIMAAGSTLFDTLLDTDADSLEVDPRFINAAGLDFRLLPSSPALDKPTAADLNGARFFNALGAWQLRPQWRRDYP